MATLYDIAQPFDKMSDDAKEVFVEAMNRANKDQKEFLKKAKEV